MSYYYSLGVICLCILFSCVPEKSKQDLQYINLSGFDDGIHHWNLYSKIKSKERLDSANIIAIANQLLAYQNSDGGWPKNIDWLACLHPDSVINQLSPRYRQSTFDNRNIYPQIEYLSKAYLQTHNEAYKAAAEKGFEYILNTENPNGGWRGWDANVITFNDEVMTGIMNLLLDVQEKKPYYKWIHKPLYHQLEEAYNRGLETILDCQVDINGEKTAWCQQHDFITHKPTQGRAYEHPSVTARESCDVILFLMRIENPDKRVQNAIRSSVNWLKKAAIKGYRYMDIPINERHYHEATIHFDRVFVPDSLAPAVWARYYDLKDGKPFLSLRDGTIVYQLSEISFDRRVGYEWYGYWPNAVLGLFPNWETLH